MSQDFYLSTDLKKSPILMKRKMLLTGKNLLRLDTVDEVLSDV